MSRFGTRLTLAVSLMTAGCGGDPQPTGKSGREIAAAPKQGKDLLTGELKRRVLELLKELGDYSGTDTGTDSPPTTHEITIKQGSMSWQIKSRTNSARDLSVFTVTEITFATNGSFGSKKTMQQLPNGQSKTGSVVIFDDQKDESRHEILLGAKEILTAAKKMKEKESNLRK